MRPVIGLILSILLASCTSDRACDLMSQRLKAIDDLCRGMTLEMARANCDGDPSQRECEAVFLAKAEPACRAQAKVADVQWAIASFCD